MKNKIIKKYQIFDSINFDGKEYYFVIRDIFQDNNFRIQILDMNIGAELIIHFISDKTNLEGENGIHEIIAGIKNVKITKEEHDKKKKEHQKIMDNDYEGYDWDFPLCFDLETAYDNSIFTKEELSQTYYSWSGEEIGYSHSYSDITICFDYFSDKVEYYKTSEVLEVLEKWKKALERWNNPEEKKKMIEEYEKKKKEE